jgi:glycerophosphoryl diester phosphodiesterase
MVSQVVIMSLEYAGIRKSAELRPEWTHGLLNAVAVGDLTRLKVNFLALAAKAASYSTIGQARERGMKVYAWTINDPVQMWVMMSRGVDGIITDRVALARQVKELRAKFTPLGRLMIWMAGEAGFLRGKEQSSSIDDA